MSVAFSVIVSPTLRARSSASWPTSWKRSSSRADRSAAARFDDVKPRRTGSSIGPCQRHALLQQLQSRVVRLLLDEDRPEHDERTSDRVSIAEQTTQLEALLRKGSRALQPSARELEGRGVGQQARSVGIRELRHVEHPLVGEGTFLVMAARVPETEDTLDEPARDRGIALEPPPESGAQIVPIDVQPVPPVDLAGRPTYLLARLGETEEVLGVPAAHFLSTPAVLELLDGVLPDRLEHRQALAVATHEVLVDERSDRGRARARHRLGVLSAATTDEGPERLEESPLVFVEQVVAPGDGRPQRLLASRDVAHAAGRRLEPGPGRSELLERHLTRARRDELDRERQAVEPSAELVRHLVRLQAAADGERRAAGTAAPPRPRERVARRDTRARHRREAHGGWSRGA